MRLRHTFLIVAFAALTGASSLAAQAPARTRAKPFATYSASAQRLKDSVESRLGRVIRSGIDPATLVPFGTATASDSVLAVARSQVGTRYRLGATAPGRAWDCSALVQFVMGALRLDLPRTANQQAQFGDSVEKDVSRLRPGDLLTFGRSSRRVTHVGVYVGDGKFIHASSGARRVVESSIAKPGTWYARHWVGVRRLLASNDGADPDDAR